MNSLSWLLYAAEVVGNLRAIATGIALVVGFITIMGLIMGPMALDVLGDLSEGAQNAVKKAAKTAVGAAVVAVLVLAVAPSSNTIMLIAVSETGEALLATPTAQQIGGEAGELATDSLKLLRKYVTEQLGETEAQ